LRRPSALSVAEIEELIGDCTYHEGKAPQIHEIARRAITEHSGTLPCNMGYDIRTPLRRYRHCGAEVA
jgi:endonuclease III